MADLVKKFNEPLPQWVKDIENEAYNRIIAAPFAEQCRQGNPEVMRRLVIQLWPFVSVFPKLVSKGYQRLLKPSLFFGYGVFNMIGIFRRSINILTSIERDEKLHRALWLDMVPPLGLQYPSDFKEEITPQTMGWISSVADTNEPFKMFLSFVTIEIIAEAVSKNFIASDKFRSVLGKKGAGWFEVHTVDHGDISHGHLEFLLAFTLSRELPTKEKFNAVVQGVISKFLDAANACV